ncbi:Zn(II)2Cys6 transcription factor domain-containing protein [Aspergillus clavatus NRRL 1]|uniref:C6 finger domain protein, putative n=1 Tax=Aspergillus clavatus (strain ATCC 1007 / CBS 513.65 / DSM 816 / NCTC 3887 / NRRL 1 / QM 1276 / 107) TaxID=344612 RepID=A1CP34_ASPCL|nr:C6 finger domain protein, putative [Aspergillus clavatus NRRL 1]EAW07405.1 C6 finger domain protein, putative [Aspergillus clavatus NRRL 1]
MESRPPAAPEPSNKRPRSPSGDYHPIASKILKSHSNHLQINYLARQYPDNLPLVSLDDTMPAILHLIGEYDGVLHRHESIAGNLGACPLGPILIKRFERLFDGPPRVLKSHGKDATITWLDVVEFAKSKPEQFNLEKSRNGVRVCQFYTKQCRVEISEEDFVLIASGMPQKMIPPQPIVEDEEKELGALEILEKNLQQIIQVADQVSARARQLNHRLKNRRTAIVTRRENDISLQSHLPPQQHQLPQPQPQPPRSLSPIWRDVAGAVSNNPLNGNPSSNAHSPSTGFVAVNAVRHGPGEPPAEENTLSSQFMFSHSNTDNVTIINGTSIKGASPTTRAELMKKFFTTQDRQSRSYEETPGSTNRGSSRPRPRASDAADYNMYNPTPATVAIPSTPSSLLPPPKSNHLEKDDGGPFKMEMVARMEELQRGERILPPCDRCRRLHMDCLKNLTACMGCTKKHAKCSWKDVREEELRELRSDGTPREFVEGTQSKDSSAAPAPTPAPAPAPASVPVTAAAATAANTTTTTMASAALTPPSMTYTPEQDRPREEASIYNARRESAPTGGPVTGTPALKDATPRRAMSEIHGSAMGNHDRRVGINRNNEPLPDDDDPDANSRLMQAIMDTVDHHARVAAAVKENGPEPLNGDLDRDRDRDRDRERKLVKA